MVVLPVSRHRYIITTPYRLVNLLFWLVRSASVCALISGDISPFPVPIQSRVVPVDRYLPPLSDISTPDPVGLCLPLVLPLFPFRLHWLPYPLNWASPLLFLVGLVVFLDRFSLIHWYHPCCRMPWFSVSFLRLTNLSLWLVETVLSWLLILKRTVFVLCVVNLFRNSVL